jgi:sec-independent protein translocase protein TatA
MIENLLSPGHLILLGIVALLVIGPKRLPEVGRGIGKALREFKHATADMTDELKAEMHDKPAEPVVVVPPEVVVPAAPVVHVDSPKL